MKFPPLSIARRRRAAGFGPCAALVLLHAACSSSDTSAVLVQPSSPAGPESPGTYGLPGGEPVSTPTENDGPGATETNFLTPPCRQDSDCNDGRRCTVSAQSAAPRDGGGAADAGEAGASDDGGVVLGHCEPVDAG